MGFSKILPVIDCFVIIHVVLLITALSGASNFSRACCSGCTCNVTVSGECSLQYREDCNDGTCIYLEFPRETSIIEVEMSVEYATNQNATHSTESTQKAATNGAIKLDIYEFDTKTKEYVLLQTRYLHINESESQSENYLTRTSKALICVSYEMDWSLYEMKFSFREWEYSMLKPEVKNPFSASGEIQGKYVPNSVSLYQLPKDPIIKWKGIEITIQDLEIDTENGEYILIGAGSPDDCPPRFLSRITEYSLFYVASASAYIEFVSRSTVKKDETFKIIWNRIDAEMPTTMNPVDTLNAILVCFYNYSEAIKEFEEKDSIDEVFPIFREAFAESVRNSTKQKFYCTMSSVKLIGHPTKFKTSNALSILMTLECEGRLFKYQELQNLMANFDTEVLSETLGYKVGLCPSIDNQDLFYKEKWSILIYALVPTLGLFILLIWAWKNNIFNQKCRPEKEEHSSLGLDPNSVPVEENTYETTIPKVCLDDGYGRRQTLIPGTQQDEAEGEEAGDVTEVEMKAIPSTSRESDTLIRVLTNRKSKRRPSIQSLISKKDDDTSNKKSDVPKPEADESDHLYDSVTNSREMNETKL